MASRDPLLVLADTALRLTPGRRFVARVVHAVPGRAVVSLAGHELEVELVQGLRVVPGQTVALLVEGVEGGRVRLRVAAER